MWLIAVGCAVILYILYYFRYRAVKPQLHYNATNTVHVEVMKNCTRLHSTYWSTPWIPNGDLLSILAIIFRTKYKHNYRREKIFSSADGQCLNLDWLEDPTDTNETKIMLMLPGISGHSWSPYVVHLIDAARKDGWRVVTFSYPGTDLTEITAPRFIRGIDHHDLDTIANHIRKNNPKAPFVAVGWSMGACLLVRYLGTVGSASVIDAAISASNPWSLARAYERIPLPRQIYNLHYASTLTEMLHANKHVFERHLPGFDRKMLRRYWRAEDFDRDITIKFYGYKDVYTYYEDMACLKYINNVQIPLLVVHARDDPLVPMSIFPEAELKANKNIMIVLTDIGGHTAWLQGLNPRGISWFDELAIEWADTVVSYLADAQSTRNSKQRKRIVKTTTEDGVLDDVTNAAQMLAAENPSAHRARGGDRSHS